MTIRTLLDGKPAGIITIRPDASIQEASHLLREKRIGAVIVSFTGEDLVGILSERDIIRIIAERGASALDDAVETAMTSDIITRGPDCAVDDVMALMTERRIRHLPVIEGDRLIGIVSIGDVVKSRLKDLEWEADNLRQFIAGG